MHQQSHDEKICQGKKQFAPQVKPSPQEWGAGFFAPKGANPGRTCGAFYLQEVHYD